MSTTYPISTGLSDSGTASRWLIPGLTAGSAFLLIEMLAGSVSTSVWAFPESIAQTIGLGSRTLDFEPTSLLAGVLIHLSVSAGLGALFIAMARRLALRGGVLLTAGVLYMWAESAVSIWLVLHTLLLATLPLLLGAVPFWASFVGRTTFGLVLAVVYARMFRQ